MYLTVVFFFFHLGCDCEALYFVRLFRLRNDIRNETIYFIVKESLTFFNNSNVFFMLGCCWEVASLLPRGE